MKLVDLKSISEMETIDGKFTQDCFHQLTEWVKERDEIQFAIDQLEKGNRSWKLRKREDGLIALFVSTVEFDTKAN